MNKKILLFSLCILLFFSKTTWATLELELTQGLSDALHISLVPFKSSYENADKARDLVKIIKNDLQNSGHFNFVEGLSDSTSDNNSFNYDAWRYQKVDDVVTGTITPLGNNQYRISFQLYDIYKKTLLLSQEYTATNAQLRSVAHRISDRIFEKLIGIRGIFSTKIAYILAQHSGKHTKYLLEVADADGYNPRTLLRSGQPIMSPAWSHDGKRIAYVSFEGNRSAIYVQEIATGQRRVIAKFPGINGAPAWSYDGTKMALVLTKTGEPKIYLLDLNTRQLRQLTFGWSLDTEPNFSPDGTSMVFTSNRGGGPQIYKLDLNTNNVSRVTYQGNYNARASFSNDGKNLIVLHQDGDDFNIAAQNLETGRLITLTRTKFDESPSVAPNGNMIVYATTDKGQGVLAEVSIDGRVKLRLPAPEGDVQEPAWSPFL